LGACVTFSTGEPLLLSPGQPVLLGFPQDEGVRRNFGRVGSALAPREIRRWLYRLSPWDVRSGADLSQLHLVDLGDLRCDADLEASQAALGEIISQLLTARAVPIVLGGGHETAFGHYLGYVTAQIPVGIINLDAHLDVRPTLGGLGHSGSPFRQALEHARSPLTGDRYVCLGVQLPSAAREQVDYAKRRGVTIRWCEEVRGSLPLDFGRERDRLACASCAVILSLDADVVRAADVPGVSAPNVLGLSGDVVISCVRLAGESKAVASFDLVEINPTFDRDNQSVRWAAVAVWSFLVGLANRDRK
jgi:formiminoglutamase